MTNPFETEHAPCSPIRSERGSHGHIWRYPPDASWCTGIRAAVAAPMLLCGGTSPLLPNRRQEPIAHKERIKGELILTRRRVDGVPHHLGLGLLQRHLPCCHVHPIFCTAV
jgi:hypothetical protein